MRNLGTNKARCRLDGVSRLSAATSRSTYSHSRELMENPSKGLSTLALNAYRDFELTEYTYV